jgi:hypothetical protein
VKDAANLGRLPAQVLIVHRVLGEVNVVGGRGFNDSDAKYVASAGKIVVVVVVVVVVMMRGIFNLLNNSPSC